MSDFSNAHRSLGGHPGSIVVLGGTATWASVLLAEPVAGRHRLISHRRMDLAQAKLGLADGMIALLQSVGQRLGRPLWQPMMDDWSGTGPSPDDLAAGDTMPTERELALNLGLNHLAVAADPLPPPRLLLAGLTGSQSLHAAQEAAASTICQPVALYRHQSGVTPQALARQITLAQVDAVVVTGGYDQRERRAEEAVLGLSDAICDAVGQMHPDRRPQLIFAGNGWVAEAVLDEWQTVAQQQGMAVPNVLPEPGRMRQAPLAVALSQLYWEKTLAHREAQRLAAWVTPPARLRSLQWSFVQGVRLWLAHQGLSDLHGVLTGRTFAMHVWASQRQTGVRIRFVPASRSQGLQSADEQIFKSWPVLGLVSGPWPRPWSRPAWAWHDPNALLPLVATLAQISPEACLQILEADILGPTALLA